MPTETRPKYQIRLYQQSKYSWTALLADLTVEPPSATTIMAKSLHELMAKVLVAVTLRDVNAGIPEGEVNAGITDGTLPEQKNVILTPNKRIITSNGN